MVPKHALEKVFSVARDAAADPRMLGMSGAATGAEGYVTWIVGR